LFTHRFLAYCSRYFSILLLISFSYVCIPSVVLAQTTPRIQVKVRYFVDCDRCAKSFLELQRRFEQDPELKDQVQLESINTELTPHIGIALIQSEFISGGRSGDFVASVFLPDGSPLWSGFFSTTDEIFSQLQDVIKKARSDSRGVIEKQARHNYEQWREALVPTVFSSTSIDSSQLIHRFFSDLAAFVGKARNTKKPLFSDPYMAIEQALTALAVYSVSGHPQALVMAKDITRDVRAANSGSILLHHYEFRAGDYHRSTVIDFEENARFAWCFFALSQMATDQTEKTLFTNESTAILAALAQKASTIEAGELSVIEINRSLDYLFRFNLLNGSDAEKIVKILRSKQSPFDAKNLVIGQSYISALISEGVFTGQFEKVREAALFQKELISSLWDPSTKLFKEHADLHPALSANIFTWAEGFRGNGNSMALMNMSVLSALGFREFEVGILQSLSSRLGQISSKHSLMVPMAVHANLLAHFGPTIRVATIPSTTSGWGVWPYVIEFTLAKERWASASAVIPFLQNKPLRNSPATVYVCRHKYCFAPNRSDVEIEREVVANPLIKVGRFFE
jgi:hypothetical protein